MPNDKPADRPTFASFWKRSNKSSSKAPCSARTADKGGDAECPSKDPTAEEKAQVRRAQVRRAQVQHRQRKADYVKELELDVARMRGMVAATQHETHALRHENDAMRRLVHHAASHQMPTPPNTVAGVPDAEHHAAALGAMRSPGSEASSEWFQQQQCSSLFVPSQE